MSTYRFDLRDGSLSEALRRIAGAETAAILGLLTQAAAEDEAGPDAGAILGLRKRCKKIRALLRLLSAGLPNVQPAENALLRETAGGLADRREAAARLATFDQIASGETDPAFLALRAHLATEAAMMPAAAPVDGDALRNVFAGLALRIESWELRGNERRVLAEGLAETRMRARTAMRAARDARSDEALHDWRKRAKDLWYQTRLLSPVWPEVMKPLAMEADILGKTLGHHHDLADLAAHLAGLEDDVLRAPMRETLTARILEAQTALETRAFPLGARLLAGDPEEVAEQWVKWWKIWRAQVG